ncbi:TPA: TIGR02646 family protein [Serratia marcescens]|nr:TIGR02646 family protein [Serratia marcescens]HBB6712728.1 TIGR02646 family protein [Serratia marcescens]
MRFIHKGGEPRLLTNYRAAGGGYDGHNFTPVKDSIRLSLLQEQGHLCAYCMSRITINNMKVEHWACQADNPMRQLDYSNLLGCCKGDEGERFVNQTCDSRKGNKPLKFNPSRLQDRINTIIVYGGQGNIYSTDKEFSEQIDTVLNLNKARLVENRLGVLQWVRLQLSCKTGKRRTKSEIRRLLGEYMLVNAQGQLKAYCGLVENYLSSKL